jgi:hypothetical protein
MTTETQTEYIQRVLYTLSNNPTAAEIDFLVEAHARIGYIAGRAESEAEMAEQQRKFDEATAAARIREDAISSGVKITADAIAAKVTIETHDAKLAEIKAYERAKKLKNLLESVTQAIHAVKFLGRFDYSGPTGDRLPK